jgi:hypothetical protein
MNTKRLMRMTLGACIAMGGLALAAGPVGASPTTPNPKASCISGIANGSELFGGVHGVGQFHNEFRPYGRALTETIQTTVGECADD